jgi:hypothetical protein
MKREYLDKITVSVLLLQFVFGGCHTTNKAEESSKQDYVEICESIAEDIELLRDTFPQLKEFTVSSNLDRESCRIEYEYKCHKPSHVGGWTSGVPNPEPDGIWLYIGIWDEDDPTESSAQINTQPVSPKWHIKNRRVTCLMLEGKRTEIIYSGILDILRNHGLKGVDQP